MTRDYKPARTDDSTGSARSLFVGLLIGLVLGVGIAAAVAIYVSHIPNPFAQNAAGTDSQSDAKSTQQGPAALLEPRDTPGSESETGTANAKDRFKFYEVLPSGTTPMPGAPTQTEEAAAETKPPAADSQLEDKRVAARGTRTTFFLQAGAFQSEGDADNQKAKLALLGYEAQVKSANVPDKGMVYRVRLGPYSSQEEVNQARNALKENGIAANVVKIVKAAPQTAGN